jgi:hypothetical protein
LTLNDRRLKLASLLVVSIGGVGVAYELGAWPWGDRGIGLLTAWVLSPYVLLAATLWSRASQRVLCTTAVLLTGSGIWAARSIDDPLGRAIAFPLWQLAGTAVGVASAFILSFVLPSSQPSALTTKLQRKRWLWRLFQFSRPDLQRAAWIDGDGPAAPFGGEPACASYGDLMHSWFDDLRLVHGLDFAVDSGWLTPEEKEATEGFHRVADGYTPPRGGGPEDILADSGWSEVVEAAEEAWKRLEALITDERERAFIAAMDLSSTR